MLIPIGFQSGCGTDLIKDSVKQKGTGGKTFEHWWLKEWRKEKKTSRKKKRKKRPHTRTRLIGSVQLDSNLDVAQI